MRIAIDTNIWVSGLLWRGMPWKLLCLVEAGEVELCMAPSMFVELAEVLADVAQPFPRQPDGEIDRDPLRYAQAAPLSPQVVFCQAEVTPDDIFNALDGHGRSLARGGQVEVAITIDIN